MNARQEGVYTGKASFVNKTRSFLMERVEDQTLEIGSWGWGWCFGLFIRHRS